MNKHLEASICLHFALLRGGSVTTRKRPAYRRKKPGAKSKATSTTSRCVNVKVNGLHRATNTFLKVSSSSATVNDCNLHLPGSSMGITLNELSYSAGLSDGLQ